MREVPGRSVRAGLLERPAEDQEHMTVFRNGNRRWQVNRVA